MPTPTVSDQYTDNLKSSQQSDGSLHSVTFAQIVNRADLLPTPMANSPMRNSRRSMVTHPDKKSGVALNQALELAAGILPAEFESWDEVPNNYQSFRPDLLPTPTAIQSRNATSGRKPDAIFNSGTTLNDIVFQNTWGKFAPAIHRWETITGNPAPAPTISDGKNGQHRLNPAFAEWMMGLPAGWITDCDITRNEQLKACGNGVVPQQATMALLELLKGKNIVD